MGNPYKARKRVEKVTEEVSVEETPSDEVVTPETEENKSEEATSEVPEGTISEVLEWVGTDADRASEALTAEEASPNRRVTLIKALEEIILGA